MKGKTPSRKLTFEDAVVVWILHRKGEFQNRIANLFDVNPGRVNEVIKGSRHPGSREAAATMR
jgi:predicted XRE-type DNA-binding protein